MPQDWTGPLPDNWDEMPPIIRLKPRGGGVRRLHDAFGRCRRASCRSNWRSGPFSASSPARQRSSPKPTDRAARDGMQLPDELVDRIRYVFAAPGETDPA